MTRYFFGGLGSTGLAAGACFTPDTDAMPCRAMPMQA